MKKMIISLMALVLSSQIYAGDAKKGEATYKKVNCAQCHNADGMGKATPDKVALLKGPRIAGLDEKYIVEQVTAIQGGKRKTKATAMMLAKVKSLSAGDIANVAAYVSTMSKDKHKGMHQ